MIHALGRIKSYLDYGMFQPIQIAATVALNGPEECVEEICDTYRERRDLLVGELNRIGWDVPAPKGTMFVWAEIPDCFKHLGSGGIFKTASQGSRSGLCRLVLVLALPATILCALH
jgi:Aspartate/tyrosine/aromatic aminotransferase